jgi:tRNA 2-thiocytidine biosynthesis protein TtcA
VETVLMNLFFNGEISAMAPKQELFHGAIHVIRPLAYVEEDMIRGFVREEKFRTFDCLCPHSVTSNRARMGKIISSLSRVCPEVKTNIYRSLTRIKKEYLL